MAFEPVQFYELASALYHDQPDNEAARRTVVSRAYYGAFLAARECSGVTTTTASVHEAVIRQFHERRQTKVANRLGELRKLRNEADYDLRTTVTSLQAGKALERALGLLEELKALPARKR